MSKTADFPPLEAMNMALQLALKGKSRVSPNPMVGAVLVKGGKILATGYHRRFGGMHAEEDLLTKVKKRQLKNATLYVSLEPCVSFKGKKRGSCCELLIKKGVTKIVIAMKDPNPSIHGRGVILLRKAGVQVDIGLLGPEAMSLNEVYCKNITTGLPYVVLKAAVSLDGRIATAGGDSRWITSHASRVAVHRLRAQFDALLTTSSTVIADNPHLGVRHVRGRDPFRVILDPLLKTSPSALVYRDQNVLVVATRPPASKLLSFKKRGIEILHMKQAYDFRSFLRILYGRDIRS
ncbi:MAG TPA: bifunctional diaminohydroxyphosphoribosylaminopyrimidine deaminase/5-amino-6-(5-phosphoribosylamino)uracil reductase RibD, partial [Candidatus Gracilibacteria bacterium]|nr:bifunctional diaminohydroxyphosphoribosylaminopyrimidine deaminase/5-amino-6-(5-phosphoribosylamino)uracil reductase RibD [Candidatus Gracilibacteria bacterium]